MATSCNPSLLQVNTRLLLRELAAGGGGHGGRGDAASQATLDDVPDRLLDRWASVGFDWVWLLGVWQTGEAGTQVSRGRPDWRAEFEQTLPDLTPEDICGSCFAITEYAVHQGLGGDPALARLRARLRRRGLRLMLDFVPNHTALDHPWVTTHPEYYVSGTTAELAREPHNYVCLHGAPATGSEGVGRDRILAYGRDPSFAGWPDTLQLDYSNPGLHRAMRAELMGVTERCDGVRCDMAMLILPEVFAHTWGRRSAPFWPEAIATVRTAHPRFVFMAEVYWDLEWMLQQQGFDYTYDKRLHDRLRAGDATPVRAHLQADLAFQRRSARFLENHDEPRAAATFPRAQHEAAAVVSFLVPGLRFFHQGQREGRRVRVSPHLCRAPREDVDAGLAAFYDRLLACVGRPVTRTGTWRLLDCTPAWDANWTWQSYICTSWEDDADRLVVVVNYADHHSQCYAGLPWADLGGRDITLRDLMSRAVYVRGGDDLLRRGLYLDLPPYGYHVFGVEDD